ncbi:flagellar motor switch protein [Roseinatronobacter sp.]|uniref:flagellar motor switch protein n=1 Tax=Roseinatronobacter sp. TaxID=1945755 RepID=UPI003F724D36
MALIIDLVILLLLAGTLGYAFLVDRRVRALMSALRGLEPVVGQFSAAVDRSENSVKSMQIDTPVFSTARREKEPRLTRPGASAVAAALSAANGAAGSDKKDLPDRTAPEMPPGMARVNGKADLVRGFFETVRSRNA